MKKIGPVMIEHSTETKSLWVRWAKVIYPHPLIVKGAPAARCISDTDFHLTPDPRVGAHFDE